MDQIKQQLAIVNANELITRMSGKCFAKCIPQPGAQVDNLETRCVAMCMDRYMDSWNVVSMSYIRRLQRESLMSASNDKNSKDSY